MTSSIPYRADLDGLRAVAVSAVVLFHAGAPCAGGFSGVDVFFVLSGFLITKLLWRDLSNDTFSLLSFYERRARRILPALFALLLACFVAALVWMVPYQVEYLGESLIATSIFSANILFAHHSGYFAPNEELNPLLHMWSLAVEEQYYLLFPLLLILCAKHNTRPLRPLLVLFPALTALGFLSTHIDPTTAFYASTARLWELMIGSIIAFTTQPNHNETTPHPLSIPASILGAALVICGFFVITPSTPWPGPYTLLPTLGAALIIAYPHPKSPATALLSLPPIVFLGQLSYSLYLWHWPIFAFLRTRSANLHLSPAAAAFGVALSLICATLSWRFIETPTRDRDRFSNRSVAILSISGALLFVALGTSLIALDGLPNRLSPKAQKLVDARHDVDPLFRSCKAHREPNPSHPACHFGPKPSSPPTFALWGDSHAPALRPAVEIAMHPAQGTLWWSSSCPALIDVHLVNHPSREACDSSRKRFIAWLRNHPEIHTVIIAGRWLPVFGTLRETGGSYRLWIEDQHTQQHSTQENLAVFQRGVQRTVQTLRSLNRNVILLGGIPEFGIDAPTILALAEHNRTHCTTTRAIEDVRDEYAPIDAILQRAAHDPNVTFIPIWKGLCTPSCNLLVEDAPLFFDDDHLSTRAARKRLGPFLRQTFQNIETVPDREIE